MTPTISDASLALRFWIVMAADLAHGPGPCAICDWRHLRVEAAALAYDAAVAWTWSGRHPRGQVRREIPG